jgi:hypothetical protein
LLAAGKAGAEGAVAVEVMTLAKGVLGAMFWNKIKVAALAVLATLLAFAAGAGTMQTLVQGAREQQASDPDKVSGAPATEQKDQPAVRSTQDKEDKTDKELAKALVNVARAQWFARWLEYNAGRTPVDYALAASNMLQEADIKSAKNQTERRAAYEASVERLQELEKVAKEKFDTGRVAATGYLGVLRDRIQAELLLHEARGGMAPAQGDVKYAGVPWESLLSRPAASDEPVLLPGAGPEDPSDVRWRELKKNYTAGKASTESVVVGLKQSLQTALDAAKHKDADEQRAREIIAYHNHIAYMQELWARSQLKHQTGQVPPAEYAKVHAQLEDFRARLKQLEGQN